MVHVCFCFTDNTGSYHKHPLVALASVFDNTKSRVRAHLICDDTVPPPVREAFTALAARYGQEVVFYPAPEIPQAVLDNVRPCFGKGSLFRLFMPELIREERVLYLDCDIICTLDVREVFEHDLGGAPLAGVADAGLRDNPKSAAYLRNLGLAPDHYINAGVLLMDLEKIRRDFPDYKDATFTAIAESMLLYMDQDAINAYFQQRGIELCRLPEAWNFMTGFTDQAYRDFSEYQNKIIHFTRDKPWKALYPAALLYWRYYALVFSDGQAFAAMETLGEHEHMYLYRFLLRNPKARRMVNRVYQISEQGLMETLLDRIFPSRKREKRRAKKDAANAANRQA